MYEEIHVNKTILCRVVERMHKWDLTIRMHIFMCITFKYLLKPSHVKNGYYPAQNLQRIHKPKMTKRIVNTKNSKLQKEKNTY